VVGHNLFVAAEHHDSPVGVELHDGGEELRQGREATEGVRLGRGHRTSTGGLGCVLDSRITLQKSGLVANNATEVWSDAKAGLTADNNYSSTPIKFVSSAPNGPRYGVSVRALRRRAQGR